MKYTVLIERYAQKQIMKLGKKAIPVIKAAIAGLADNLKPTKTWQELKNHLQIIS